MRPCRSLKGAPHTRERFWRNKRSRGTDAIVTVLGDSQVQPSPQCSDTLHKPVPAGDASCTCDTCLHTCAHEDQIFVLQPERKGYR